MNANDSSRVLSTSPAIKNQASFLRRYHQHRRVDRRSNEEKWKRMCGVIVSARWGSGKGKKHGNVSLDCSPYRQAEQEKHGNASVGCTPSRHAPQDGKMETLVCTVCRDDSRSRKEKWKHIEQILKKKIETLSRCSPW